RLEQLGVRHHLAPQQDAEHVGLASGEPPQARRHEPQADEPLELLDAVAQPPRLGRRGAHAGPPRPHVSTNAGTAVASAGSFSMRASIAHTAKRMVLGSRSPNSRPICVDESPAWRTQMYMATWRGQAHRRGAESPTISATVMP